MMSSSKSDSVSIALTDAVLDVAAVDAFLRHPACGAVSTFVGTTRQFTEGRETEKLAYDAYPSMAVQKMERLAEQTMGLLGGLPRVGRWRLEVIGVATPHRDASFAACRYLIDTLKTSVPIWKREHYADGTTEWVEGTLPGPPTEPDS